MSGSLSPVARGNGGLPRWATIAIACVSILAAGGVFYWLFLWPAPPKTPPVYSTGAPGGDNMDLGLPLHEEATAPPAAAAPPSGPITAPPRAAAPSAASAPSEVTVAPMTMWVRPNSAELLKPRETPPGGPNQIGPDGQPVAGLQATAQSAYAQSVTATHIADTRPMPHFFPPAFTIKKGTVAQCTPPMPLDTQLPGPAYCLLDAPVKSMDGNNILLPVGTQINMQIERGLGQGQDRAVVILTDAQRPGPDYVDVPLDFVGAGSDGQNGVPVDINEHLWQKLKAAGFAAIIEGGSGALSTALNSGGGGNQYIGSFGNQTQSLAAIFAQHDVNIPTTGYRGAGRSMSFYANHNIDTSLFLENMLARR